MKNILFQARQFAFWMGVVLLFRILLHIPDAEGMLPVHQLELFSSCMDMFLYGLFIIYAAYILRQWQDIPIKWQAMLGLLIGGSSILIGLHLLSWRMASCDPDVYWQLSPWWFKAIYLCAYTQLSAVFLVLFWCMDKHIKARWWALAIAYTGVPNILVLGLLTYVSSFLCDTFVFMLFKDLSMDIACFGLFLSLGAKAKKG